MEEMQRTIEGLRFAMTTFAISGALVVLAMSIPAIRTLCNSNHKVSAIAAQLGVVLVCGMLSLTAGFFLFLK